MTCMLAVTKREWKRWSPSGIKKLAYLRASGQVADPRNISRSRYLSMFDYVHPISVNKLSFYIWKISRDDSGMVQNSSKSHLGLGNNPVEAILVHKRSKHLVVLLLCLF